MHIATSGDDCLHEDEMGKQVDQLLASSDCDAMLSISQTISWKDMHLPNYRGEKFIWKVFGLGSI